MTAAITAGWLLVTTFMNLVMFSNRKAAMLAFSRAAVARRELPWRQTAMMATVTPMMMRTKTTRMVVRRVSVPDRASARVIFLASTQVRPAIWREAMRTSSPV